MVLAAVVGELLDALLRPGPCRPGTRRHGSVQRLRHWHRPPPASATDQRPERARVERSDEIGLQFVAERLHRSAVRVERRLVAPRLDDREAAGPAEFAQREELRLPSSLRTPPANWRSDRWSPMMQRAPPRNRSRHNRPPGAGRAGAGVCARLGVAISSAARNTKSVRRPPCTPPAFALCADAGTSATAKQLHRDR